MEQQNQRFEPDPNTGIIAWFARNPVAANLLMLFIIIAGMATALFSLQKQMFPQSEINSIEIRIAYPGAAPKDVEENIAIRVEESLDGIQGLDRIVTYSFRNGFSAYIRVDEEYDLLEVMDEIKVQIDGIPSFPDGIERPIVRASKYRQEVLYISLYGDLENKTLKKLGEDIYAELQEIPIINVSEYYGGLNYEVSIEVSKHKLREYNLSIQDVANSIRRHSVNLTAGQIKAEDGYITLRAENQAYVGKEFSSLPVFTTQDGSQILLKDIANVDDGFEDGVQYSKFNGKNAKTFFIGASESQDITEVAKAVKEYIEKRSASLPAGVALNPWVDFTYYLEGRLNMMLKNMLYGGILVFLMLALFLKFQLAFWVMLGLPIAFFGALLFMPSPWVDITINVTSLFGFIMVLGIVVDDAIVIGESVNTEIEEKGHSVDNVIRGAKRVAMPATFGVLTTIAAFGPMVFASGPDAAMSHSIGFVVVLCLAFSLVESKLILPAHLAQMKLKETSDSKGFLNRLRRNVDSRLKHFVHNSYKPKLAQAIQYRYFILALFVSLILISAGLFQGQIIRMIGFPKVPHDFPVIRIEMQEAAPERATLNAALAIEAMINQVDANLIAQFGRGMIEDYSVVLRRRTRAEITVKLTSPELRPINTFELSGLWRDALPPIPGKKTLTIQDSLFSSGREDGDISFRLAGRNYQELDRAVDKIKARLEELKGVGDVNDSRESITQEVQLKLKPLAYSLGFTVAEIASQTNASLYGIEAQRILRNSEEIKVMVRYPESERNAVSQVKNILIRTNTGVEMPLSELAHIQLQDGVNLIRREDSKRTIGLWANVDKSIVTPTEIHKEMKNTIIPEVIQAHPTVSTRVAGRLKRELERNQEQIRDIILTVMVIYILLAIPLKSYIKPLIIISVIPFGAIGAMIGHLIFGKDMSSLSLFGIIAASGVVINDSLVMVDFISKARARGVALKDAVIDAGVRRFRAIILTSITTFIGLIPIIFEPSLQAKIVSPMAIALAFGVLFATVVTLFLIPCLYIIGSDIKSFSNFKNDKKTHRTILIDNSIQN